MNNKKDEKIPPEFTISTEKPIDVDGLIKARIEEMKR